MRIRIAVPEEHCSPDVIDACLEAVTRLDEHMIRAGQAPSSHELIKAGAVWRPENMGDEHFDHGGTIATRGWGDCDDWAPLHAATLRANGEDPGAVARVVPSGPATYHAIVQRSDGSIDDPSIAAGMKAQRVGHVGGASGDEIHVRACDPHDGRIYEGSLAPAVGPLAVHCGPAFAVRGCHVVGHGDLYEARCDVPLNGSPLIHVRSYYRHKGKHHRRRHVRGAVVVGQVPYAISCSSFGLTPAQALNDAIVGAVLCGDAAELSTSLDRYKMLAVQAGLAGATPGQVHDALVRQMAADLQAAAQQSGQTPEDHARALLSQVAANEGAVVGYVVGGFFGDLENIANSVVHAASGVVNSVAHAVSAVPWGDIIHGAEAAVSVVPVLGTAVSDVLATAETAYDAAAAAMSGNPLEAAIHAAYNYALASVPGAAALRFVLDPVVNTLISLTVGHEPIESAILDGILQSVPDAPKIASISPRSIAASLAHLIVGHLGMKNTGQGKPAPKSAPRRPPPRPVPVHLAHFGAFHPSMAMPAVDLHNIHLPAMHFTMPPSFHMPANVTHILPAPSPAAVKPLGVPHAAVPASAVPRARPGSPGAPPGATKWTCTPGPAGSWHCQWT